MGLVMKWRELKVQRMESGEENRDRYLLSSVQITERTGSGQSEVRVKSIYLNEPSASLSLQTNLSVCGS